MVKKVNNIKIDDELKCKKTINNLLGQPLFIKDKIYKILWMGDDTITLDHILYGNEYSEFDLKFIKENFDEYEKTDI